MRTGIEGLTGTAIRIINPWRKTRLEGHIEQNHIDVVQLKKYVVEAVGLPKMFPVGLSY